MAICRASRKVPPPRARRMVNSLATALRAREHQVRKVDTGNQQNKASNRRDDPQRPAQLRARRCITCCGRHQVSALAISACRRFASPSAAADSAMSACQRRSTDAEACPRPALSSRRPMTFSHAVTTRNGGIEEIPLAAHEVSVHLKRQPHIRWSADGVSREAGSGNTDYRVLGPPKLNRYGGVHPATRRTTGARRHR